MTGFHDAGEELWYGRTRHQESAIQLWGIHPLGRLRDEEVRTYDAGGVEIIDGATIPLPNYHGLTPMEVTYVPDFRDSIREADVRLVGFTESLSITLPRQ